MQEDSRTVRLRADLGRQAGHLRRPIMLVIGISLGFLVVALTIGSIRGIGFSGVLNDYYTLTGERWTSLVSNGGVLLWMSVIAITLFAAVLIDRSRAPGDRWWSFLVGAAAVTTILLVDDSLSFHESGDDLWVSLTGTEPGSWISLSELAFWAVVAAVFAVYFWRVRDVVARTEHLLLIVSAACFVASIGADVVGGRIVSFLGLSGDIAAVGEEGLKLIGIVTYVLYFVRSAALAVRQSGVRGQAG